MNLLGWISLGVSVLLTVAGLIVRYNFDKKLEILRADLRAKGTQIDLLRSGAISALASRQSELHKRRIEAVDKLWSAVVDLAPVRTVSAFMATPEFKVLSNKLGESSHFRQLLERTEKLFISDEIVSPNISRFRPFVSEISWAMFSTYQALALLASLQVKLLQLDPNKPDILFNTDAIYELIEVVLPHQLKHLKEYGLSGYHLLLIDLESHLLKELQNVLRGEDLDKAHVEQSVVIMKNIDSAMEEVKKIKAATPALSREKSLDKIDVK